MARNMEKIGCGYISNDAWAAEWDETSQTHASIAAHIAICSRCRSAAHRWRLVAATLQNMTPASAAVENAFVQSVLATQTTGVNNRELSKQRRVWQWTGLATTAVAVAMMFMFIGRQPAVPAPQLGIPLRVSSVSIVVDEATPPPGYIIPHNITHVRDDAGPEAAPSTVAIRVAHGRSIQ